jgi:probable F420-dependent oxidoreductase
VQFVESRDGAGRVCVGITCGGVWWGARTYQRIEALGFDSIWTGEHIVFHRPVMDALPVVAGVAAVTDRVLVGPAALMAPLRHPTLLAKELASIDIISGGRLVVATGVGGDYPKEFEACGVPHRERGRRMTESLEIMRRYWTERRFSHRGELFQLEDVSMHPKPVSPGGPRVWVAGRAEAAIERAVRFGDGYLPYMFTPEDCAEAMVRLRAAAERLGEPLRAGFTLGALVYVSLADDDRDAARRLAVEDLSWRYNQPFDHLVDRYCVYGDADDVVEGLRAYVRAGVTHFVLAPVQRKGAHAETVERYAEQLMPALHAMALTTA